MNSSRRGTTLNGGSATGTQESGKCARLPSPRPLSLPIRYSTAPAGTVEERVGAPPDWGNLDIACEHASGVPRVHPHARVVPGIPLSYRTKLHPAAQRQARASYCGAEKKENGQPKGGMGGRHAATTQGF